MEEREREAKQQGVTMRFEKKHLGFGRRHVGTRGYEARSMTMRLLAEKEPKAAWKRRDIIVQSSP